MSLVKDTISNFIGGVSHQSNKLMYPNQAKEIINGIPNPSVGLIKRYPSHNIAKLMNTLSTYPKTHTIIKENEQYEVFLTGDGIKVFDLEGNEKTVNIDENTSLDYVTTETPLLDLAMTTIGDYTFILNKTVTCEMEDDLYPSPHKNGAIVFVKQGDYAIDYVIKVNGNQVASKTTSKDNIEDCKTNGIAGNLKGQLDANLGSTDWDISIQNSTILIKRKDGEEFTIQTSDSNSDRNLMSFYKETDDLTDLPVVAPKGFIVKIVGEDVNKDDDYYVQFQTADGSDFGTGSWQECPSPNCTYKINLETMPHALIREADGTFTFKTVDYTNRRAGDEDSAKTPSFIGNTIQEIFTHKGRIGFISADKSIYSDTEDIFAYFKKTTLTKLDTDPIDVNSNSKMVMLKHSLPFNNELLLFSDTSEFTVSSGDIFSNSTVTVDLTMEYDCSSLCKPVNVGDTGLFVYQTGEYSGVYEAYIASTYNTAARCITEQVPNYLPSNIFKIAASPKYNTALFLSATEKDTLYVYNFYYSSEQKAQSAWCKWKFEGREILDINFYNNYLYIVSQYSDGIYLERIDFTINQHEEDMDYPFYLDRKITVNEGVYDDATEKTTLTLPYPITKAEDYCLVSNTGFLIPFEKATSTTITIDGDREDDTFIFGKRYTFYWKLGTIYKRQTNSNGTTQVQEGLLMLKGINLSYFKSGYFAVKIIPNFTSQMESTFEYTGIITGTTSAVMGRRNTYSGVFMIPVLNKNDEIEIEITNNTYLPSNFLSLDWLGDLCLKA